MKKYYIVLITLLMALNACQKTTVKEKITVFNKCKPLKLKSAREDDLEKEWFYLSVMHGEKGFNPVFIPFDYKAEGVEPDSNQSLSFPALLSFKFDFVPDNYTSRHPAYIYACDYNARSVKYTDPAKEIAAYIKAWSATHAIAGELVQSMNGYAGSMIVFDRSGSKVLEKKYKDPMPYFNLMGTMVMNWMDQAGWSVSDILLGELMRPMTKNMETVRMYGRVFSFEHRSHKEWKLYDDILNIDPDFAEVRFWSTNQQAWQTGSDADRRAGYARALQSHLVMHALQQYPYDVNDTANNKIFVDKLTYAETVYPDGNPGVLERVIDRTGTKVTTDELDLHLPFVLSFPCDYQLLCEFAHWYRYHDQFDKAIPLCLSALNSGYLTGTGSYAWPLSEVGRNFAKLGYLAESEMFCRQSLFCCDSPTREWTYSYLAENLRDQFRFKEAAELFRNAYLELKKDYLLCDAYMCLFEAGDIKKVYEWLSKPITQTSNEYVRLLISVRLAITEDDLTKADQLLEQMPFEKVNREIDNRLQIEAEIVKADIILISGGKTNAYQPAHKAFIINPRSRRTLYLVESSMYEYTDLGKMYTVAALLFPDQADWQKKLNKIRKHGYKDESDDEILRLYAELKKYYDDYPYDKNGFWFNAEPYFMEYLCLRMAEMADKDIRDKGLALYLQYYFDIKGIFEVHTAHVRAFFLTLLSRIAVEERNAWKQKI